MATIEPQFSTVSFREAERLIIRQPDRRSSLTRRIGERTDHARPGNAQHRPSPCDGSGSSREPTPYRPHRQHRRVFVVMGIPSWLGLGRCRSSWGRRLPGSIRHRYDQPASGLCNSSRRGQPVRLRGGGHFRGDHRALLQSGGPRVRGLSQPNITRPEFSERRDRARQAIGYECNPQKFPKIAL